MNWGCCGPQILILYGDKRGKSDSREDPLGSEILAAPPRLAHRRARAFPGPSSQTQPRLLTRVLEPAEHRPSAPPPDLALGPLGRDLAAPPPTGQLHLGEASPVRQEPPRPTPARRLGAERAQGSRHPLGSDPDRSRQPQTSAAEPTEGRRRSVRLRTCSRAAALRSARGLYGNRCQQVVSGVAPGSRECSVQLFAELAVCIFSDCPSIFPPFSIHCGPGDGRGGSGFYCCTN